MLNRLFDNDGNDDDDDVEDEDEDVTMMMLLFQVREAEAQAEREREGRQGQLEDLHRSTSSSALPSFSSLSSAFTTASSFMPV